MTLTVEVTVWVDAPVNAIEDRDAAMAPALPETERNGAEIAAVTVLPPGSTPST